MAKKFWNQFSLLFILPFFWGSTFLATKICITDLPPIWMGAIRYLLSSLILFGMLFTTDRTAKPYQDLKKYWLLFLAIGAVGTFSAAFFQNIGLMFTTASMSSLIGTLEPVMVAVMSVLFLRERLSFGGIAGISLAFFGGLILITNGNPLAFLHLDGTIKGNLLIFVSIASYACYTIFTKALVTKSDPLYAVTFSSMIGTIMLIIAAIFLEKFPDLSQVSIKTWLAIIYLAIFPTCIALLLFNQLLTRVEASKTSVVLFLIPMYGLALGIIFLGEKLSMGMIFGGILTIIGVWLIEYKSH